MYNYNSARQRAFLSVQHTRVFGRQPTPHSKKDRISEEIRKKCPNVIERKSGGHGNVVFGVFLRY